MNNKNINDGLNAGVAAGLIVGLCFLVIMIVSLALLGTGSPLMGILVVVLGVFFTPFIGRWIIENL